MPSTLAPPEPGIAFRLATDTDALCIGVPATQVFLDTYATDGIRPSLALEVLEQLYQIDTGFPPATTARRCWVVPTGADDWNGAAQGERGVGEPQQGLAPYSRVDLSRKAEKRSAFRQATCGAIMIVR
ncbi:MAG: hypothetical protein ABI831_00440 [Betaproteobacteria bacterium]